jgi:heme/copper-type cytochrome/quinol oxidase subunit 2
VFLYLIKKTSFVKVLGVGGVISGGLTAILILLMVKSAKKKGDRKPEYSIPYSKILTYILAAIFIIGAVLEIAYTF